MPMVAAPVALWLGPVAAGGTIGLSAGAAAIGGAVVAGAVTGAIIGAATAAFTGGDILKGALIGAAVGGVTGGIGKGFSLAAAANAPATGVVSGGTRAASEAARLAGGADAALSGATSISSLPAAPGIVAPTTAPAASTSVFSKELMNTGGKMLAGIGKSLLAPTLEEEAEGAGMKTAAEIKARHEANQPGVWDPNIMNIRLPERWQAMYDPVSGYKKPLEKQGLVRPNAEVTA